MHRIAILQRNALAEAESIGTKKMHMGLKRKPVSFVLEMMVFQVLKVVRHVLFTRSDRGRPNGFYLPSTLTAPIHSLNVIGNDQLGTDGALSQFGRSQVEVILFLHDVVRELIPCAKTNSPGCSGFIDDVGSRYFGLLSPIVAVGRHFQRLAVARSIAPFPL